MILIFLIELHCEWLFDGRWHHKLGLGLGFLLNLNLILSEQTHSWLWSVCTHIHLFEELQVKPGRFSWDKYCQVEHIYPSASGLPPSGSICFISLSLSLRLSLSISAENCWIKADNAQDQKKRKLHFYLTLFPSKIFTLRRGGTLVYDMKDALTAPVPRRDGSAHAVKKSGDWSVRSSR